MSPASWHASSNSLKAVRRNLSVVFVRGTVAPRCARAPDVQAGFGAPPKRGRGASGRLDDESVDAASGLPRPSRCGGPPGPLGTRGSRAGHEGKDSDEAKPRLGLDRMPRGGVARRPELFPTEGACGNPRKESRGEGPLRGPRFSRRSRSGRSERMGAGLNARPKRLRRPKGRRRERSPRVPASDSELE